MDSERQSITAFASSTSAAKHTITKLYNIYLVTHFQHTHVHADTCLVLVMCLLMEYIEECAMPHVPNINI